MKKFFQELRWDRFMTILACITGIISIPSVWNYLIHFGGLRDVKGGPVGQGILLFFGIGLVAFGIGVIANFIRLILSLITKKYLLPRTAVGTVIVFVLLKFYVVPFAISPAAHTIVPTWSQIAFLCFIFTVAIIFAETLRQVPKDYP